MPDMDKSKSMSIRDLIVSDEKLIKILDEKYKDQFYIPPFETRKDSKTGINWELVDDGNYVKSKNKVGEISDVIVAICDNDPYKNDSNSIFRIDGRVVDGRTRYLSSLKHKVKWKHKYILVKDFEQFVWFWCHFNSLKGGNVLDETSKFLQLCKFRNEITGMEKEKIGQSIILDYGNNQPFNNKTLRRRIPPIYKEKIKMDAQLKREVVIAEKRKKEGKKLTKNDKVSVLEIEKQDLIRQNFDLDDQLKELKKKTDNCDELKAIISNPETLIVPGKKISVKVKFDLKKKGFVIE